MTEDIRDLKAWTTIRAQLALHKVQAYRTDPADGPRAFVTVSHGVARMYPSLGALQERLQALEVPA